MNDKVSVREGVRRDVAYDRRTAPFAPSLGPALELLRSRPLLVPLACLGLALYRRSAGWDPGSLWLDDQWIAIALREAGLAELFRLQLPAPFGFVVLEKLIAPSSLDPEWPLQIVPLLAGLAVIPVFWLALRRVVRHPGVIAIACVAVSCHATAELYGVRVKHYALDLLLTTAILGATIGLLQKPDVRRFAGLLVASASAAFFSFASLLFSLCAAHVLALDQHLRGHRPRAYAAGVIAFDLAVAAYYFGYLHHQSCDAMRAFWQRYFLRFDSLDSLGAFAYHGLGGFALHAMSPWLIATLALVVLGVRAIARDPQLRPLNWILGLLLGGLLCAAWLEVYPFGRERTSLFAFPLLWVLAAIGGERALLPHRRAAWLVGAYVLGASLLQPRAGYSDVRDRQVVEAGLERRRPGDALLTTQHGLQALAYYGGKPVQLVRSHELAHRFEAIPDWPDLYVLPIEVNGVDLRADPTLADDTLASLAQQAPPTVVFISTHATDAVDEHVVRRLEAWGYAQEVRADESPRARLIVLQRLH